MPQPNGTAKAAADGFVIRPLAVEDTDTVVDMLAAQRSRYLRFFHAFGTDADHLRAILRNRRQDVYAGMFWDDELICVFTLRGWDDGYNEPSFGIVVCEDRRRYQLAVAALESAKIITRFRGASRMMCKVHPENRATVKITLRLGFEQTGEEARTGNGIYHLKV